MSVELANFLFESANFLVLALALSWVLFKPMRAALQRERTDRERLDARVAEQRQELERLEREAASRVQRAEAEATEAAQRISRDARQQAEQTREQARIRDREAKKQLEAELDKARRADTEALATEVAALAGRCVHRLLEEIGGPPLQSALTARACLELRKLGPGQQNGAVIETAEALRAEERRDLSQALGGSFEERVVPELGAGLRITTARARIDASALAMAQGAALELGDRLKMDLAHEH